MDNSGILLEKNYQIPYELFKKAFTAFQKKFVYPRNYCTIVILLFIILVYGYFIATAETSPPPLYFMIIFICLVLIFFQWYNPKKIRRNLLLAIKEIEQDQYRIRIFPEYLEIGTFFSPEDSDNLSEQETDALFDDTPEENFSGKRIYYNKYLSVLEYDDFLMIYQAKTMFYVLPKAIFSEEELEIIRVHFSQRLGKTFQKFSSR